MGLIRCTCIGASIASYMNQS